MLRADVGCRNIRQELHRIVSGTAVVSVIRCGVLAVAMAKNVNVVSCSAREIVVGGAAVKQIVAAAALQNVGAAPAIERVRKSIRGSEIIGSLGAPLRERKACQFGCGNRWLGGKAKRNLRNS